MSEIELITEDYKIGLRHYSAFYQAWRKRNPVSGLKIFLVALATLGSTALTAWQLARGFGLDAQMAAELGAVNVLIPVIAGLIAAFFAAIYITLFFVVSPLLNYLGQMLRFLISPQPRLKQQVTISNREICKTSNLGDAVYDWRSLQDIVETKTALLFFTAKNSALIIPKSAFCSQAAAYHFVTLSQTLSAQARRAA